MVTNILLVAILVGLVANWLERRKARSAPREQSGRSILTVVESAETASRVSQEYAAKWERLFLEERATTKRLLDQLALATAHAVVASADPRTELEGDPMSVTEADRASAEQDRLARELERARRGPFAGGRSPSRTEDDEAPGLHRAEAASTGEFDESDPAYDREQESGS